MIKMKALRSFRGAGEGKVRRGREFSVASERRAIELETADPALAYRLAMRLQPEPVNQMLPTPSNKAAEVGPLASVGGTTGETEPVPSSHPDRQQQRRRSKQSDKKDLLS